MNKKKGWKFTFKAHGVCISTLFPSLALMYFIYETLNIPKASNKKGVKLKMTKTLKQMLT